MRDLGIPKIVSAETANMFILGLIFNQNQRAERAWQAPALLKERLGGLDPEFVVTTSRADIIKAIIEKPALHPFGSRMASNVQGTFVLLLEKYGGDGRNIWTHGSNARDVLTRLQECVGIGKHKANVGLFLLREEFHIPIAKDGTESDIENVCSSLHKIYSRRGDA